tara:strand:- start:1205 stop:1411 length:207 start_codon:yes stop_codon:yes gene_type:complete
MQQLLEENQVDEILKRRTRSLMLGTKLERLFVFLGIKKVVKVYEEKTGKPCGCAGRKNKLDKVKVPFL